MNIVKAMIKRTEIMEIDIDEVKSKMDVFEGKFPEIDIDGKKYKMLSVKNEPIIPPIIPDYPEWIVELRK